MLELKKIESFFPSQLRHFKRNILREYLQYKILEVIFTGRYGQKLVFMGGTAIHIAYGLPRFSEDLDFDNRGIRQDSFKSLVQEIKEKLSLEGYEVQTSVSFKGAFSADIKFVKVLFNEGLSGHREEKILIKIDTEPQNFRYSAEKIIINKFDVFKRINIVPVGILLAQKFYAIFARKRAMGRDFYDAIFLSGKTEPDFAYLKKRLGIANKGMLQSALLKHCAKLDFRSLSRDVEQFVFSPEDAKKILLFPDYVRAWNK
jgi:predicted nucleotidyltransferase component of viral defense system